ncbi:MAG: hypothetical protein ACLFUM_06705 [Spirochaetaceae bacterium]
MESDDAAARPQVLVPYPGPEADPNVEDIFVYMRPETNGVVGEAEVLRVIEESPQYKTDLNLVYLANIPGPFIMENHVVERHYAVKMAFAVHGKSIFTEHMKRRFREHFKENFDSAPIIGAFEALDRLGIRAEELFQQWVDEPDILVVDAQSIKRVGAYFVVNYDIPALIHKNNRNTDIAVMLFRTRMSYEHFLLLTARMREGFIRRGLLDTQGHVSRVFHFSKSPVEQILDARGYLYEPDGANVTTDRVSFAAYLMANGVSRREIDGILDNPIAWFRTEEGIVEDHVVPHTRNDGYPDALEKLRSMVAQHRIPL